MVGVFGDSDFLRPLVTLLLQAAVVDFFWGGGEGGFTSAFYRLQELETAFSIEL